MKKLAFALSALAALALLAPTPGSAYDNIMAFVFDDPATIDETTELNVTETAGAFSQVLVYVVLLNSTEGALFGFEIGYTIEAAGAAPSVLGMVFEGPNPIDVGTAGNHIVGTGGALATSYCTKLATMTLFLMDANPINLTLHGVEPNSVPGSEFPTILGDADLILECGTSAIDELGSPALAACINCGPETPVATDEAAWDSVKALYR